MLWEGVEGLPVSRNVGGIGVELWLVSFSGGMMIFGFVRLFICFHEIPRAVVLASPNGIII